MKTWDNYKEHVKSIDAESAAYIEDAEAIATIIGAIIEKRKAMGISQRKLATICGIPQSSVARMESYKTTPKLETLLKILQPLGLGLSVTPLNNKMI